MGISLLIAIETRLDPAPFTRLLHGPETTKIASENEWLTGIISKKKHRQEIKNEHKIESIPRVAPHRHTEESVSVQEEL